MSTNNVTKRIEQLLTEISTVGIWRKMDENSPLEVNFEMQYPNGKHGDIDMFIAEKWGQVQRKDATTYNVVISTKYANEIELLVAFYYLRFSMNALRATRTNDDNALRFLRKYNRIYDLSETSSSGLMGYDVLHDAYNRIKETRNNIYNDVIAMGKANPKWSSEQRVYIIAKELYPSAIFQYHAGWLGRQSLDIYIPELKVGIEYQGLQHYYPVDLFGGEANFEKRKILDEKKRELCIEQGVSLIYWKYDELITVDKFYQKILDVSNKI